MLFKRILTVIIGAPIVIGALFYPILAVFKIFVAVCAFFALLEFFTIVGFKNKEKYFYFYHNICDNIVVL